MSQDAPYIGEVFKVRVFSYSAEEILRFDGKIGPFGNLHFEVIEGMSETSTIPQAMWDAAVAAGRVTPAS